jgi:hypothetical protein
MTDDSVLKKQKKEKYVLSKNEIKIKKTINRGRNLPKI